MMPRACNYIVRAYMNGTRAGDPDYRHGSMTFTSPVLDAEKEFCLHYTYRLVGTAKLELFMETPQEVKMLEKTTPGEELTDKVKIQGNQQTYFIWTLSATGGNIQLKRVQVQDASTC